MAGSAVTDESIAKDKQYSDGEKQGAAGASDASKKSASKTKLDGEEQRC